MIKSHLNKCQPKGDSKGLPGLAACGAILGATKPQLLMFLQIPWLISILLYHNFL